MRLLARLVRLLVGLLYRLFVLILFERWIPFPERSPAPSAPSRATRRKQKKLAEATGSVRAPSKDPGIFGRESRMPRPAQRELHRRAFFDAESSELAPDVAARREGEHRVRQRAPQKPKQVSRPRESLGSLLRSPRAIRDAIVLGSALGAKRPKP